MKRTLFMTLAAFGLSAMAQEAPLTQPTTALTPTTATATQPAIAGATTEAAPTQPSTQLAPGTRSSDGGSGRYSRRDDSSRNSAYPVQKLAGTQYAALEQRSIFYHGFFRAAPEGGYIQRDPGPPRSTSSDSSSPPPERNMVFRGATEFDDEYVAFVEDLSAGRVQMVKAGDAVARGKMGPISLNYLDYFDKTGKSTRIAIGKTLEGSDPPSTQPSFIAATPSSSYSSTTSPSNSSGIMSASDAVIEAMKRRRAEGK